MEGWTEPVDGETESERRERLAFAAAHDQPPFDGMADTDRRFLRDVLRASRDGAYVAEPHNYDELIKPRDGSQDTGALRPW